MRPRKAVSPQTPRAAELPRASFRLLEDDASIKPGGVHDQQARSYGYNNFDDFERPDYYIRYIEPIENELANQVEYDMDEQDQEWLDSINEERKKDQLDKVSYETFEILMDKVEKEWFDLMKRVPKSHADAPPEDSTCAVCDDGEGENSNAIVFCDGCNLAVHQECYGIPYIPEGQWLCRKCTISPEIPVSCVLCPNEAGAFKQTNTGKWVHLLCALWNPEVTVTKGAYMEPIEGIERISKPRWRLLCTICGVKKGACIQCQKASCATAFHVTCARQLGLLGPMKSFAEEEIPLRVFCERHLPPDMLHSRRIHSPPLSAQAGGRSQLKSTKAALAHSSGYAPPPPTVPNYIVDRLLKYIAKIVVRKKREFVCALCKYWSLKREARRGAPLLKRLHLEPWTATSGARQHTEEQKIRRLALLARVRNDIERIRIMAEFVVKRERTKQRRAEDMRDTINSVLFPHEDTLKEVFEKIVSLDRLKLFATPVSRADVPDYYNIVKNPMDWTEMGEKLNRHEYYNAAEFEADVHLVFDNSTLYNASNTQYYKQAVKCKEAAAPILSALDKLKQRQLYPSVPKSQLPTAADRATGSSDFGSLVSSTPSVSAMQLNDMEASMESLELLEDANTLTTDLVFHLEISPLEALFEYPMSASLKPQVVPPPSVPATAPIKLKRDKAGDKARREELKARAAAERQQTLEFTLAAPRTRQARKQAEAFQAEANLNQDPAAVDLNEDANAAELIPSPIVIIDPEGPFITASGSEVVPSVRSPPNEPRVHPVEESATSALQDVTITKVTKKRKRLVNDGPAIPPMIRDITPSGQFQHFETGWVLEQRTRSGRQMQSAVLEDSSAREQSRDTPVIPTAERASKRRRIQSPKVGLLPTSRVPLPISEDVHPDVSMPAIDNADLHASRRSSSELTDLSNDEENNTRPGTVDGHDDSRAEGSQRIGIGDDGSSDGLSFLREGAPNMQKNVPVKAAAVDRSHARKSNRHGVGANPITDAEALQAFLPSTLVWAKMDTFPWFPGRIYSEEDAEVPAKVLSSKADQQKRVDRTLFLVRFYDRIESWQWVQATNLHLLGEDKDLDELLLDKRSIRMAKLRSRVQKAYEDAMAQMETPEDVAHNNETAGEAV